MTGLLFTVLVILRPSLADAAPFDLTWSAPPGCPSRGEIVAATRARLGDAEDDRTPPELFVEGTVTLEGDVSLGTFRMKDAEGKALGERRVRFEEQTCAEIAEPASLVLAMMIAFARPRVEENAPASLPPAPASDRAALAPTPPAAVLPSRVPIRVAVSASTLGSLGLLPHVGFGAAFRVTGSLAPILLGLETSFERSPPANGPTGGIASFGVFDIAALAGVCAYCSAKAELVPVIAVRGGIMSIDAKGFPVVRSAPRPIGFAAIGVLGRYALGRNVRLEVMPDVRIPFVRDEFQLRERTQLYRIHRPSLVETRLSVGIGWEFL